MTKLTPKKIRYSVVSITATILDFGILLLFTTLGLGVVRSNYISTSIGFIYSFFANKKFTFRTSDKHLQRELIEYIFLTLVGIWVIQPIIIHLLQPALAHLSLSHWLSVVVAKIVASLATFVWNYFCYTRVVFWHREQ